jgi:hypothetical protein
MEIEYGHRYYGKVDSVRSEGRELCYVVTGFRHIAHVPLFPTDSKLVLGGTETRNAFQGIDIPLCRKSVGITWVRTLTVLPLLMSVVEWIQAWAYHSAGQPDEGHFVRAVVYTIGIVVAHILTVVLSQPKPERAAELCRLAGIDQTGNVQ